MLEDAATLDQATMLTINLVYFPCPLPPWHVGLASPARHRCNTHGLGDDAVVTLGALSDHGLDQSGRQLRGLFSTLVADVALNTAQRSSHVTAHIQNRQQADLSTSQFSFNH